MSPRPCLVCGELVESGSRCPGCRPKDTRRRTRQDRNRPAAWDRLSKRLRKASPQCEACGNTERLELDHIIPVSVEPSLALEPLNCRVLCLTCNRKRGNTYTPDEAQAVHEAIKARNERRARYYASQSA